MPSAAEITSATTGNFMQHGTRVRVRVPGRAEPLYGLVAFFRVSNLADGAAKRVYRMDVPESYVAQAVGGFVSVVYQPYDISYVSRRSDQGGENRSTVTLVSWALWMSDVPFYDAPPTAGRQAAPNGCTNTCRSARDYECDDGGPGSLYSVCELGTDCADCGQR